MRIKVHLFFLFLLCAPHLDAKVAYASLSADKTRLSFHYDDERSMCEEVTYDLNSATRSPVWNNYIGNVTTVVFDNSFADARPVSCLNWFKGMTKLTTIEGLQYLNTSEVTNMHGMFEQCENMVSLDLRTFDTSNVTNMGSMFEDCGKLRHVKIAGFNTASVTTFSCMFYKCAALEEVDVANFDTSNCKSMYFMFRGCYMLETIDVSNFDTSNVTMVNGMFESCSSLRSLDVSHFNLSKAVSLSEMFCNCSNLEQLNVGGLVTSNNQLLYRMFMGCSSLTTLDLSLSDMSTATSVYSMFEDCSSLVSLDLGEFNVSHATSLLRLFAGCKSLQEINLGNLDTRGVTNMNGMFSSCSSLKNLDVGHFDTSNVTDMANMFYNCKLLKEINVSGFDTSKVNSMVAMFRGCASLSTLDLSNLDMSNVGLSSFMMDGCSSLESLKLNATASGIGMNACGNVGTVFSPCLLVAPPDFNLACLDSGDNCFVWKSGCFQFVSSNSATMYVETSIMEPCKEIETRFYLDEENGNYLSYHFLLSLTDGVSLLNDGMGYVYELSDGLTNCDVDFTIQDLGGNLYGVVCRSLNGEAVTFGDAPFLTLVLKADYDYQGTTMEICAKSIRLSQQQLYDISASDFHHISDVEVYSLGDLNMDSKMTISDVTALVDCILGNASVACVKLADLNQDGYITVADVTALVDIILGN